MKNFYQALYQSLQGGQRGLFVPQPPLEELARTLTASRRALVLTGFPIDCGDHVIGETDGPCGAAETANARVINQFIHPDVLPTCQLSMGLTQLSPGSVWNTMPAHTHERRMEVYTYFNIPEDNVVFHMMGQGQETRHIVMQNYEAVISPSWSIHCGCGTGSYTFIWAMGGENQAFDDMDNIPITELR